MQKNQKQIQWIQAYLGRFQSDCPLEASYSYYANSSHADFGWQKDEFARHTGACDSLFERDEYGPLDDLLWTLLFTALMMSATYSYIHQREETREVEASRWHWPDRVVSEAGSRLTVTRWFHPPLWGARVTLSCCSTEQQEYLELRKELHRLGDQPSDQEAEALLGRLRTYRDRLVAEIRSLI